MAASLEDNFNWLEKKSIELIHAVHRVSSEGIHCWLPALGSYDVGCWMRDFAYMLIYGPQDAFDWDKVISTLNQFVTLQQEDGAIPDYIIYDGLAEKNRGKASYAVIGAHACEDNPAFLVLAINRACEVLKDNELFKTNLEAMENGLNSVSLCPASGLVFIDPLDPHSGYGFCDIVDKRGHDLFCSLLWWEAASILAEKCSELAMTDKSQRWQKKADWIKQHIIPAFWSEEDNLLLATTLRNRQADIWGSAYAVAIGAVDDVHADRIAQALLDNYDKVTRFGQVRHTLSSSWKHIMSEQRDYRFGSNGRPLRQIEQGIYQNGAFWATPVGWFAATIARKDKTKARQLVKDCIDYLRNNGVYECFEVDETAPPEGRGRVIDYVASAVNPLFAKQHL